MTKSAGGLGLKRVEDEAYMESFCSSWLNLSVGIKISLKCSWGWRKLLIGGILMIFFTPATSYGYIVVYDAASSLKAKVSSVLKEKNSLEATLVNSLVSTQYKLLLIVD